MFPWEDLRRLRLDESDDEDEELGASAFVRSRQDQRGVDTPKSGEPKEELIIDECSSDNEDLFGKFQAEAYARRHNTFTKQELLQLQNKAEVYFENYTSFKIVEYIYRDKPKSFFDAAAMKNGIMEAYNKDNTGDPKSPINGKIDGLFFATSQPPSAFSYFGNTRIKVPAKFFLSRQAKKNNTLQKVRLYFADFYCMDRLSRRHWVTLVLTYKGSVADEFCSHKLPRLQLNNNPFLVVKYGIVLVKSSDEDRVEIFYTENVDLNYWKKNEAIVTNVFCQGTSTPGGKPKRAFCQNCNI